MFEYYFSKGFAYFDCTKINLAKLPKEVKDGIYAEEADNLDKFMICSTTITYTLNTLKSFNYSYIKN